MADRLSDNVRHLCHLFIRYVQPSIDESLEWCFKIYSIFSRNIKPVSESIREVNVKIERRLGAVRIQLSTEILEQVKGQRNESTHEWTTDDSKDSYSRLNLRVESCGVKQRPNTIKSSFTICGS